MARNATSPRIFLVYRWRDTAPPASPEDEPCVLLATSACTGDFAGHDGELAVWWPILSDWVFIPPTDFRGDILYRLQENQWYNGYDGSGTRPLAQWHSDPATGDLIYFNGTTPVALTVGAADSFLTSNGTIPAWQTLAAVKSTLGLGALAYKNTITDSTFIDAGAVALSDIENINNNVLLGNASGGAAAPSQTSLGAGGSLAFSGGRLVRGALTGDVTASSDSNSTTIANDAVTYAKMQNVSATDKVLGRSTAGSGDVEEIACTSAGRALIDDATAADQRTTLGLGTIATQASNSVSITGGSITGITDLAIGDGGTGQSTATAAFDALSPVTTRGDIIYRNASNNARLAVGSAAGMVLKSDGTDPGWGNPRIFESAVWHQSTATAVGARTRGYVQTTSFDAGVCVPSGKTFKLWRQSTCVKTGATVGSNYDIEHGVTEGVGFAATQIGTNLNNSEDTNVMFENVASDANTPLTSISGPTRITMWWGVVTGSTGALASTQHSTQIVYSVE